MGVWSLKTCLCVYVLAFIYFFFKKVPLGTGALMFSARSVQDACVCKLQNLTFSSLRVRRGAQVLFYFCTPGSEVCAATELSEERRSFASAVVLLGERAYRISL